MTQRATSSTNAATYVRLTTSSVDSTNYMGVFANTSYMTSSDVRVIPEPVEREIETSPQPVLTERKIRQLR